MSKLYEETPISQPPKEDGRYIVTNGNGWFEVSYDEHYSFHEEFTDCSGITHYLRPVEGNVLTDEEVEAVASKAWDAGYDFCNTDGWKQIEGVDAPDKDTYLKSIKK